MHIKDQIQKFVPSNIQEENDKDVIMDYIHTFGDTILNRSNRFAHMTSSGLILNKDFDKVLMVHHNIYNTWAWTGGHVDGEEDLLAVAIKEAKEETGIKEVVPIGNDILSVDILTVFGHFKNGEYISSHLHLSVAYALIADESSSICIKEDENSGVRWIDVNEIVKYSNEENIIPIYHKIIKRVKEL